MSVPSGQSDLALLKSDWRDDTVDGEDFLFLVKGKTAGSAVSLGLKGDPLGLPAKGIKIKAAVETKEGQTARIAVFSGKGLGQALSWTR